MNIESVDFNLIAQNLKDFFFNQFWLAVMELDPVSIALLGTALIILLFCCFWL